MEKSPAQEGWYPDPEGHPVLRFWDGTRWTDATRSLAPAPAAAPGRHRAPLIEVRHTTHGLELHPRGSRIMFSSAKALASVPWIALFLTVMPFGALVVGNLVNLSTGHPTTSLPVAATIEVGLFAYLSASRRGRAVLSVALRYVIRRRLRVAGVAAVVLASTVWAMSEEATTARAEAPARHELLRAAATLLRADSSEQFFTTAAALNVLTDAGVDAVAGTPHHHQVGVVVTKHGGQAVFLYDSASTGTCIAIVITGPSALDPAAASPTNLPVAYGEWADYTCDPARIPASNAYLGAGGVSWTASQHDWLTGS